MISHIPEGLHAVTPYLLVSDAERTIAFLRRAFGAPEPKEMFRGPNGRVAHAQIKVGDSTLMLGEPPAPHKPTQAMYYLYVPDVDATFRRAREAGAKVQHEVQDMFYGDRTGAVVDGDGNTWWIATRKEIVPPEELARRAAAAKR